MPHVSEQPRIGGNPTQPNRNHPRHHQGERDRRDIHTEQIDLAESHVNTPASKYSACWASASDTTRMLPRALIAPEAPGASLGRDASAWSRTVRRAIAKSLLPCASSSRASA